MARPQIQSLIQRCDELGQAIETLLAERDRLTPTGVERTPQEERRPEPEAHVDDARMVWATTLSSEARVLLGDLREAGLSDGYLLVSDPHPDPHSAEKWQAASEARDFLRTDWVDETGIAHLARYFRFAADRLRQQTE